MPTCSRQDHHEPPSNGGLMANIMKSIDPTAGNQNQNASKKPEKSGRNSRPGRGRQSQKGSQGENSILPSKPSSGPSNPKPNRATPYYPTERYHDSDQACTRALTGSALSDVSATTTTGGSSGDIQCMQQALAVSKDLDALRTQQQEVENQICELKGLLDQIKNKRRQLKEQRIKLLQGLAHSDSDDGGSSRYMTPKTAQTSAPNCVIAQPPSVGLTEVRPVMPSVHQPVVSMFATLPSITAHSVVPAVTNPQTLSAGQLGIPQTALNMTLPSFKPFSHTPTPVHSLLPRSNLPKDTVTAAPPRPLPPAPTTPSQRSTHSLPGSSPLPASQLTDRSVSLCQAVPNMTTSSSPFLPPYSATSCDSTGVDLQRLALIRQAFQSPDSVQYTFGELDDMVRKTATAAAVPSSLPIETPEASSSFILQSPTRLPQFDTNIIKPSGSSPSSFESTDDESGRQKSSAGAKDLKSFKLPIKSVVDPAAGTVSSSVASSGVVIDADRSHFKCGEFHAFGGGTAAVVDLVLHYTSDSIFIGGQNGVVSQFNLKNHQCVRKLLSRDASVTRMCLDSQKRVLLVGFYDNYLREYSSQLGTVLFDKFFSHRIDCLAAAPSVDIPYIYLGMSNGQVLRHNIRDHTSSVLCQPTPADNASHQLGISSLAVVRSGSRILLLIGSQDHLLYVCSAIDGSLVRIIRSAPHKNTPQGITCLPIGCTFMSFSERSLRLHNWKTGNGVMTIQCQKITSCCVMENFIAVGESEGAVRVYKLQNGTAKRLYYSSYINTIGKQLLTPNEPYIKNNGLPLARPMKVYFASTHAAVTSLIASSVALIAGSLDGTVTVIYVNEPTNNYVCMYGPFGNNCGIGFANRSDLVKHVVDTHFVFGRNKSVMCRWGAGRCKARFNDSKNIKAISDHLLIHIPD